MVFNIVPQVCAADWAGECISNGDVATITGIECLIGNLLQPLPILITLIAVGMIIFAGFQILTAGADPKKYAAAWQTFTFAIVGVILLSVVWLALVLIERFTGAPVTKFGLP